MAKNVRPKISEKVSEKFSEKSGAVSKAPEKAHEKGEGAKPEHMIDQLADMVASLGKRKVKVNAGLSISGLQHIGRLRGETILTSRVVRALREKGIDAEASIVVYTDDEWKAKESQMAPFGSAEKALKYKGFSLIDVPDPFGCHDKWVSHYMIDFFDYLPLFDVNPVRVYTHEFYATKETQEVVHKMIIERAKIASVLNKFRDRNKLEADWYPFRPRCGKCRRINSAKMTGYDEKKRLISYSCDCGNKGTCKLNEGKLDWRMEWAALWHVLGVDFEPYGKDHMVAGGSRDSCIAVSKELGLKYPLGFGYEWIYIKEKGEEVKMSASGFRGMTPKELLTFCEPEVFAYLVVSTKLLKAIVFDPSSVNLLYDNFDKAEKIYYGTEKAENEREEAHIKRSYEFALPGKPAKKIPLRVPFLLVATVAQAIPDDRKALERLKEMGHVPEDAGKAEEESVLKRISLARAWAAKYAPENVKYSINEKAPESVVKGLSEAQKKALKALGKALEEKKKMNENALGEELKKIMAECGLQPNDFFRAAYLVLMSKERGPRLAPFILALGREKVAKILESV